MRLLTFLFLATGPLLLSGCYMDAHIGEMLLDSISVTEADDSTIAVAPSSFDKQIDNTSSYRARSTVGEVSSGPSATSNGVYSAEVSITYQRF